MPLSRFLLPLLVFIVFALGCVQSNRYGGNTSTPTEEGWAYNEQPDKMGRGVIKTASVTSTNTLSFKFPYSGEQHARLILRKHPAHGNDVMIRVERGQFLAGGDASTLSVRFDESPPVKFSGMAPTDGSSEVVGIVEYDKFVNRLRRANRLRIEATFFQEGNKVLDFDVGGLKW